MTYFEYEPENISSPLTVISFNRLSPWVTPYSNILQSATVATFRSYLPKNKCCLLTHSESTNARALCPVGPGTVDRKFRTASNSVFMRWAYIMSKLCTTVNVSARCILLSTAFNNRSRFSPNVFPAFLINVVTNRPTKVAVNSLDYKCDTPR